jgi:hypothetical protein
MRIAHCELRDAEVLPGGHLGAAFHAEARSSAESQRSEQGPSATNGWMPTPKIFSLGVVDGEERFTGARLSTGKQFSAASA